MSPLTTTVYTHPTDEDILRVAGRPSELALSAIDPEAVRRALEQFTEVWDVLFAPERERVVRLLIERIEYHGGSCDLSIAFSPVGANMLVTEASR